MKTIKIILGASIALLGLIGCDKKQEEPVQPHEPTAIVKETNVHTPKKEQEKPPTKDILALKSLGLKPLEIDHTALPPLPEPDDPSDKHWARHGLYQMEGVLQKN